MKYTAYTVRNLDQISQIGRISKEEINDMKVVASVLPFKTNNYVVDELIDWDNYREDPLYILNFPQRGMLREEHFNTMRKVVRNGGDKSEIARVANDIRIELNPHPAGQLKYNVPELDGHKLLGIQHKYNETVLFFPTQGQTCHAYCTFCFRWPQFTGMTDMKFAMKQTELLIEYLKRHPEVTDLLFTGGDPMIMSHKILSRYINALLDADIPHLRNIRIGTKSLAFWPYKYLTDKDSDDILRLFESVGKRGKHLAFMAHFNHAAELKTEAVGKAITRIQATGAQIRTQAPLLNHINADPEVWKDLWQIQVKLGLVPYYMFVARDTGAQEFFSVNLGRAFEIFTQAYRRVSGIARTVRGPSMSASPGKVQISGVTTVKGEKVYVLRFIQGRNPKWVNKPFFAKYDPEAVWLDDLEPAFGADQFFYEEDYRKILNRDSKVPDAASRKYEKAFDNCSGD